MMIGHLPTVHIPQWDPLPDPTPTPTTTSLLSPSAYASALLDSDDFRMYEFKIRRCVRGRSHDWTDCPFAHPGEKARRRDPRRHPYSGSPCPDFRKGSCKKGDSCEFSHGVFECWLHPARYRTQPCKDGVHCTRRVCFFAHTPDQLRVVADQDPSPPVSPDSLSGLMRGLRIGFTSPRCYQQVSLTPSRLFDAWGGPVEEEPAMERVESGKDLRAAMYAKLRRENSMDQAEPASVPGPDFGWVAELVK